MPETIRRVSSGRWLIPLLASMSREEGSRFGALAVRLSLSKSVLARHLDLLEQFGWIVRNPGHGHPLRPEYLLTGSGAPIAAWCAQVMSMRASLGLDQHAFGRWTLPLLFELAPGWQRFTALQQRLTPVTPRALSLTLKQAERAEFVDRNVAEPAQPPLYGLSSFGRRFALPLLV